LGNSLPPQYQKTTYLTDCLGNNAFDFEKRSESNPEPQLRLAPLIQTNNLQDLRISRETAFEVYEENKTRSFAGLENFLQLNLPNLPPIYIFDNHNHAFYFWHFEKSRNHLTTPARLIHIDQHKDSRIPASFLNEQDSQDLNKVYQYTNEILNVGNFIPPAFHTKLISEFILVDSSQSLNNFASDHPEILQNSKPQNLILDLDLDFFAPELDYIGNSQKLTLIKQLLPLASVVTIATSPFFLDQQQAIKWCQVILSEN